VFIDPLTLFVDANAVLPGAVAVQQFQPVARRRAQVSQAVSYLIMSGR
jgi:hypothetical protein